MKQVTIHFKTFALRSLFRNLGSNHKAFSKCLFVVLLAGLTIAGSSFRNENPGNSFQNLVQKSIPFNGKYGFSLATNTGTGEASHIGRFLIVEPGNSIQPNQDGTLSVTGTAILTAANGDQIFANHTGLVSFNEDGTAHVDARFTITGGTGRFTGATGSFESNGLVTLALGTGLFTFDGLINY